MKITKPVLFSLYYASLDADEAWEENLRAARVERYSAAAKAVLGYADKLKADAARLAATSSYYAWQS